MDARVVAQIAKEAKAIAEEKGKIVYVYKDHEFGYVTALDFVESGWLLKAYPGGRTEYNGAFSDIIEQKKAFIACPVRGITYNQEFMDELDALGKRFNVKIHFPPRDTNQDDPTGLQICKDNRAAIEAADVVFVLWDGKSQGVLFDLGMAFAANKRIMVIDLPDPTDGKSFQNMIRSWEAEYGRN